MQIRKTLKRIVIAGRAWEIEYLLLPVFRKERTTSCESSGQEAADLDEGVFVR